MRVMKYHPEVVLGARGTAPQCQADRYEVQFEGGRYDTVVGLLSSLQSCTFRWLS